MARSYQQMILLGNLGKDPDLRYTGTGMAVCTLTVATTEYRKNKETDQWEDETEWHRVVVFGKQAEAAGEYLRKGRQVFIVGKKKTRSYDKDGQRQYITEVLAEQMQIIGAKTALQNEVAAQSDAPVHHSQGSGTQAPPTPAFSDDDIPM